MCGELPSTKWTTSDAIRCYSRDQVALSVGGGPSKPQNRYEYWDLKGFTDTIGVRETTLILVGRFTQYLVIFSRMKGSVGFSFYFTEFR